MLMTQYISPPAGGDTEKLRPLFRRTPLRPKNNSLVKATGTDPKRDRIQISMLGNDDSNKENRPPLPRKIEIESLELDLSLAEELRAIREKLERLRLNRERTEKMLNERDELLQIRIKELQHRGQIQRQLELEIDRFCRLDELKSCCRSVSPIRSLRAKEQDKVKSIHHHHHDRGEDESIIENVLQSPNTEIVAAEN